MLTEDMYNRICNLFNQEGVRLENNIIEHQNYIFRFRPSEPTPYIRLIQAQAEKDYFDRYIFTLLDWFNNFIESG